MTWYNRKQLTPAFQGPGGSYSESKLVDLVLNKKARADSLDLNPSTTTEQENSLLEAEKSYANLHPKGRGTQRIISVKYLFGCKVA